MNHATGTLFLYNMGALCNMGTALCNMGTALCDMLCNMGALYDMGTL